MFRQTKNCRTGAKGKNARPKRQKTQSFLSPQRRPHSRDEVNVAPRTGLRDWAKYKGRPGGARVIKARAAAGRVGPSAGAPTARACGGGPRAVALVPAPGKRIPITMLLRRMIRKAAFCFFNPFFNPNLPVSPPQSPAAPATPPPAPPRSGRPPPTPPECR